MTTSAAQNAVRRTAADEAADRAGVLQKWSAAAFDDWPNEAGFDGLTEETGPIELVVTGTIPSWAAGQLYRTGPGQATVNGTPKGTHAVHHWFDGLAHTHRFEIVPAEPSAGSAGANSRVFYSSRRQSDKMVQYLRAQGPDRLFSFGQRRDPCIGLLGKFMSTFRAAAFGRSINNTASQAALHIDNVNVAVHADVPGFDVAKPALSASSLSAASPSPSADSPAPTAPAAAAGTGHRAARLPSNVVLTTDASVMQQVDPETLEPIGVAVQTSLHPDLKGPMSSAHAQRDAATGDWYNFNLDLGRTPTYRLFRVSAATGTTDILATIRCGPRRSRNANTKATADRGVDCTTDARPAYIHSFFLTAHYVILCIPCTHVACLGLQMLWRNNVVDGIVPFDPANKTRWIVVDRRPPRQGGLGVVAQLESDAGFFFHTVNAYEEKTTPALPAGPDSRPQFHIVADVVDYPNFDVVRGFYYDVLLNRNAAADAFYANAAATASLVPTLSRFRLPLPSSPLSDRHSRLPGPGRAPFVATATRVFAIPGPHIGDLPSINPRYTTRPHRFVYSVANRGHSTVADCLCKTDTATRDALLWHGPPSHVPGEPIFVPRPAAAAAADAADTAEDDGVLLSVVLDGHARSSYLLCLDAQTMQELGRAEVSVAVGLGFHGVHVSYM